MKNMKIGTQIMLVTFFIAIITILGLSLTSTYYFSRYARKVSQESAHQGIGLMRNVIETEKLKVKTFRDQLAVNETIAEYVANRDTQSLNTDLLILMQAAGIDIVMVTDADGIAISRPHDPERVGDSLANDETVKMSLSGQTWDILMSAPSARLGYYCGTPIKSRDGQIVGMLRTAVSLENESLVDGIKALYDNEATIFAGNTAISTTFMEGGKRLIDTEASEFIQREVLQQGKDVEMSMSILGKEYFAVYSPLREPSSGRIMGMYFNAKSADESQQAIRSTMIVIAGVSAAVFVIAFLVSLLLSRSISKPLGRIVALSERGRSGDLTIKREDFHFNRGGELGALVGALSEMISAQQKTLSKVVMTANDVTAQVAALNSLSDENASAMSSSESLIQKVSGLCDINARAVELSASSISEMSEGADSVAAMSTESAESLADRKSVV